MLARAAVPVLLLVSTALSGCGGEPPSTFTCAAPGYVNGNTNVNVTTNMGSFIVQLWGDKAPITVCNFLTYVGESFYDNTCFHRIVKSFVVQGGGYDRATCGPPNKEKTTHPPIKLEADASRPNVKMTVAMARTGVPDSATSQFYVNTVDNSNAAKPGGQGLDPGGISPEGYAVFGIVTSGWNVVTAIEAAGGTGNYMTSVRLA